MAGAASAPDLRHFPRPEILRAKSGDEHPRAPQALKEAMRALVPLAIFVMLLGCVRTQGSAVLTGCKYIATCDVYHLELNQVVGDWAFNPHALVFARSVAVHSLLLPRRPSQVATFDASQLKLTAMSAKDGSTAPLPLKSGNVKIDLTAKRAVIDLSTSSGPFSGNGTYPLSTLGF
jgi:hypothetical protein